MLVKLRWISNPRGTRVPTLLSSSFIRFFLSPSTVPLSSSKPQKPKNKTHFSIFFSRQFFPSSSLAFFLFLLFSQTFKPISQKPKPKIHDLGTGAKTQTQKSRSWHWNDSLSLGLLTKITERQRRSIKNGSHGYTSELYVPTSLSFYSLPSQGTFLLSTQSRYVILQIL